MIRITPGMSKYLLSYRNSDLVKQLIAVGWVKPAR